MTRQEAVLKLLALGPAHRTTIALDTGWPSTETNAVVEQLLADKRIAFYPVIGNNGAGKGVMLCLPATRQAALETYYSSRGKMEALRRRQRREAAAALAQGGAAC